MWCESNILKGKYFPHNSSERLKSSMVMLLILVTIFIVLIDAYGSYRNGYRTIVTIKVALAAILAAGYFLFPRFIALVQMVYAVLIFGILFSLSSLFLPGIDSEFLLFTLSTLPIFIFFFLGEEGAWWSVVLFAILLTVTVGEYFGLLSTVLGVTLLAKVTMGYMAVSYFLYLIEKEHSRHEEELTTALKAKEILFKEVHHRTKNNMQVMMGLLETQSFKIQEPKYKKMFQAHVDRIKAMSYVHENLYSGNNYEKVDMNKYLHDLIAGLQNLTPHAIITDIEYVTLDMKTAMSVGLICNEAISNAIEHAYYAGAHHIDVTLKKIENQCQLTVKDYGKGFDTSKTHESLGVTLIEDLSVSLPYGGVAIHSDKGTEVKVTFDVEGG